MQSQVCVKNERPRALLDCKVNMKWDGYGPRGTMSRPFCFCHFKGLDLHIDRETDMIKVEGKEKIRKSRLIISSCLAFARRLAKSDDDHHRTI